MPIALRTLLSAALMVMLAACSSGGLPAGLSQRMDAKGVTFDRAQAIAIINQYRGTTGSGALTEDPALDAAADALVLQYAKSGTQLPKPAGAVPIRYSAGYFTFAETFSGWRNSPAISTALTRPPDQGRHRGALRPRLVLRRLLGLSSLAEIRSTRAACAARCRC